MGWLAECMFKGVKAFFVSYIFLMCWCVIVGIAMLAGRFLEDKNGKK